VGGLTHTYFNNLQFRKNALVRLAFLPMLALNIHTSFALTAMSHSPTVVQQLLQDLKHQESTIREVATQTLWRIWFEQKGSIGLQLLQRSQELLNAGELQEAEWALTRAIQSMPDFAEAWNRRAVLYFMQRQYLLALDDCYQVVRLNEAHFGAWHGLGLCHAALGQYQDAIQAFRQALVLQPHSLENQRQVLECTACLN
jgi:tetratricopeptide (TPR) repeat protein